MVLNETIKYTNLEGDEITQEQAINLGEYFKFFIENNIVIKKEFFQNNQLRSTVFVVSSQNEINTILQETPTTSFELNYQQNGYGVKEHLSYTENMLSSKRLSVYDNQERLICSQVFDITSGTIVPTRTEKTHYNLDGEKEYSFGYKEDGTCFKIYDELDPQGDIHAAKIGDTTYTSFTWAGFEFYQFAEPSVPNN